MKQINERHPHWYEKPKIWSFYRNFLCTCNYLSLYNNSLIVILHICKIRWFRKSIFEVRSSNYVCNIPNNIYTTVGILIFHLRYFDRFDNFCANKRILKSCCNESSWWQWKRCECLEKLGWNKTGISSWNKTSFYIVMCDFTNCAIDGAVFS